MKKVNPAKLRVFFVITVATAHLNMVVAAQSSSSASPVKAVVERKVYYPGSEDLAADEIRVIAWATGMPNSRLKQAAACWIFERAGYSLRTSLERY